MTLSIEDILAFTDTRTLPSVLIARALIAGKSIDEAWFLENSPSILQSYDDGEYSPTFEDIDDWLSKRAKAFSKEFAKPIRAYLDEILEDGSPTWIAFRKCAEKFIDGEVDYETHVSELATFFECFDQASFWHGKPSDEYWHVAKIEAAVIAIARLKLAIADAKLGILDNPAVNTVHQSIESEADRHELSWASLRDAEEGLLSVGIKLGFLFRDAWWIENHGEMVIKGYMARTTSMRAGEGGGKQSNQARQTRIRYFLAECARLVAENPILRDDPPDDVACRAMKKARQRHPKIFKTGHSRRAAKEYWEYIRSDKELYAEYEILIQSFTYTKNA